jgi:hypothetical protein
MVPNKFTVLIKIFKIMIHKNILVLRNWLNKHKTQQFQIIIIIIYKKLKFLIRNINKLIKKFIRKNPVKHYNK